MTETPYTSEDILLFADRYARKKLDDDEKVDILTEVYSVLDELFESKGDGEVTNEEIGDILNSISGAKDVVNEYQDWVTAYKALMN